MFPGRIKRETSPQLGWKTVKLLNPNFLQTTSNYYTSVYILQTFKLKLTSKLIWTCRCVLRNEYIFAVTNKSTNKIWEYLFKVNHQDTRLKINHKSYIGHLRDRLSYIDRSSSGFIVDFAICFDICYWKSINVLMNNLVYNFSEHLTNFWSAKTHQRIPSNSLIKPWIYIRSFREASMQMFNKY